MGYWGWRPLVCGVFFSAWVTGCTIVTSTDAPPTDPTEYPSITLTTGRLPNPTAPPRASQFYQPLPVSPMPRPSQPAALLVLAPTCYDSGGRAVCLGLLINQGRQPVSDVAVEVALFSASGTETARVVLEQSLIAPGQAAPYGVSFPRQALETGPSQISAQPLFSLGASLGRRNLDADNVQAEAQAAGALWRVSGTVHHSGPGGLRLRQAVATLLDGDGQVLGYRVLALDEGDRVLEAGASRVLTVGVFAHGQPSAGAHARLTVEAEAAPANSR